MKVCPRCAEVFPDDSDRCGFDGSPLRQEVDALLGKTIAQRYRLISRVGAGRVSIVYLGRHVMIDRLSAIKILRPQLVENRALCERFLREARAVNRINHENIVEISDYGEAAGIVYLVMEYVPGQTMHKHLSSGLFSWPRAASIGVQIASALGRAHQMGIVHREVTPNSILLVKKKDGIETAKLIDFGLAKMMDVPTREMLGIEHPGYAAPETITSGTSDPQSDLYSLGAVLYEAVSGMLPFGTVGVGRPTARGGEPVALQERVPHLPEPFSRLVMQLLASRPDLRPRDAFVVFDELNAILRDQGRGLSRAPPPVSGDPLGADAAAASSLERAPETLRTPSRPSGPVRAAVVTVQSEQDASLPRAEVERKYRAPEFQALAVHELELFCRDGLVRLERSIAHLDEVAPEAARMLADIRGLLDSVALAGEASRRGQAEIARKESQCSEVKASFGRALDELGHDLSRAGALVTDIDERIERLAKKRESEIAAQMSQRDAWLWEQGALAEEVERARAWRSDLIYQIGELRKRLDAQTEELDRDLARSRAALEGQVAALRTLARETWAAIEQATQKLGVPLTEIEPPGPEE